MQVHVGWLFAIAIVSIVDRLRKKPKPKTDEYTQGYNDALQEMIDVWNKNTDSKDYKYRLGKMLNQLMKMGCQFDKEG